MKDLLKRELITWLQYSLITCVAAVVGFYAWDSAQAFVGTGTRASRVSINIQQMVLQMWRDYFRWILGAFMILISIRFLVVLALGRAKLDTR